MNLISLQLAYNAIKKQKTRAILTVLMVSIGISAVIVIFSAGYGLNKLLLGQLEIFGTDIIEVEVKVPNTGKTSNENAMGMAQGLTITTLKNDDVAAIRKNSNIEYAYGAIMGQELVAYEEQIKKIFLMGIGFESTLVSPNYSVAKGRAHTKEEEDSLAPVAVLGSGVADKLFGEDNPIGKNIKIKNNKFRVVGVMEEKGSAFFMNMDDFIYVPITTLQKRILGVDYLTFIMAKMKDPSLAIHTQNELIYTMREQHNITDPNKDDFAVNTMDEAQKILGNVVNSITYLLIALVGVSLIVGGVGIMNIMYVSVAERTFEIGLRKSLGAKKRDILWQFLFEALLITIGGGVVGVLLGTILAYLVKILAVNYGLAWQFHVSISSILIAVFFSLAVGLLFGIYPARKAAALEPIVALRKE
jgi:putative ABC transport system permease protein